MKNPYVKSGKVGNRVYSRNRYGPICYERFIPTNPRTPRQMAVRQRWGVIAALWRLLNDAQRAQWRAAGGEQRSRRRMGRSSRLTGFHYFMRLNMLRTSRGEAWVDLPPLEVPPRTPLPHPQDTVARRLEYRCNTVATPHQHRCKAVPAPWPRLTAPSWRTEPRQTPLPARVEACGRG